MNFIDMFLEKAIFQTHSLHFEMLCKKIHNIVSEEHIRSLFKQTLNLCVLSKH